MAATSAGVYKPYQGDSDSDFDFEGFSDSDLNEDGRQHRLYNDDNIVADLQCDWAFNLRVIPVCLQGNHLEVMLAHKQLKNI